MMKTVMTILLVLAACSKQSDDKPRHEPEKHEPGSGTARPAPPKPTPLPIKAFVELATGQLAFKPQNVLGKTPVDVAKALPQYLRKDETSAQVKAMTDEMMKELQKENVRLKQLVANQALDNAILKEAAAYRGN